MKIFLAGMNYLHEIVNEKIEEDLKVYLADCESRHYVFDQFKVDDGMKLYLAGVAPWLESGTYDELVKTHRPFILESFYYVDDETEKLIPYYGDFLLDSGAFTFMQNAKSHVNWDEYIERYAAFIVKNNVEKFFELDIDSIVGYGRMLEFRHKLEKLTGRQSIPVWHISRGKEDYINCCKSYPYVAVGGIVIKEIKRADYKYFPWFISTAHKYGAKVHALGFTALSSIEKYHFDSVDSSAWTTGNRFGFIYQFNGRTMARINATQGHRLKNPRAIALNNFNQWVKFQEYAVNKL